MIDRPAVRVVRVRGERALVAGRALAPGETILIAEGAVRSAPSRLSVQIGPDRHLEVPLDASPDAHAWRYLNHACRPNTSFRGAELVALEPIGIGDELTFDYETTEWELAVPFACACGSMGCTGREVRGFRHLSHEERMRRLPQLRDDLRRLVRGDESAAPVAP